MKIIKLKMNKGAAMMILFLFFVVISTTILLGVVVPVVREYSISSSSLFSRQAYFNAESGMEDIIYRIKNNMETGTVGDDRTLLLGDSYVSVPMTIINGTNNKKYISVIGDENNRERNLGVTLTTSSGTTFNYGVLVGQGGIYLDSGTINGNVYSNGPITASSSGSNIITGSAVVANDSDSVYTESNSSDISSYNITFGNTTSTQDIAQSFTVSSSKTLNKIELYLKRYNWPSDMTVKVVNDSSGKPGTTILDSATISTGNVGTSYTWVTATFSNSVTLSTNTTYWFVIDYGSASLYQYYIIGALDDEYSNGLGKIGQYNSTWNNTNPADLDYLFNIYLGTPTGYIKGYGPYNQIYIGTSSGLAWANTVDNTNVNGNVYCQSGSGNSKTCVSKNDPDYVDFPISDDNILVWKEDSLSGGTYSGNYSVGWAGATLGPKKIDGNLSISGGGTLVLTGNLWVTGNLILNGGGTIKLDSSYGSNDAVIVVDGTINVSGGGHATGSGSTGSYIMLLTTSSSTFAATLSGGAGAVIMYAPNGTLNISGGASLNEATAYKINISGGSSVTYESGLVDNNFSSGASGSWSIDSWEESE